MARHVLILLQVTFVIVQKDILETTVKQVRTTQEGYFFQCIFSLVNMNSITRSIRTILQGTLHALRWEINIYAWVNSKLTGLAVSFVAKCLPLWKFTSRYS